MLMKIKKTTIDKEALEAQNHASDLNSKKRSLVRSTPTITRGR